MEQISRMHSSLVGWTIFCGFLTDGELHRLYGNDLLNVESVKWIDGCNRSGHTPVLGSRTAVMQVEMRFWRTNTCFCQKYEHLVHMAFIFNKRCDISKFGIKFRIASTWVTLHVSIHSFFHPFPSIHPFFLFLP